MTSNIAAQAASLILSALVTLGTLASVNGIATHQFTAADTQVMTQGETTDRVAVQSVVIIGHRVAKA